MPRMGHGMLSTATLAQLLPDESEDALSKIALEQSLDEMTHNDSPSA